MPKVRRKAALAVTLVALVALNVLVFAGSARAHDWGCYHFNRYGSSARIEVRNTATYRSEASAAVNEWSGDTVLYLPQVSYHTDISVYDGNYGATGWGGLASLESVSGCHILHGHATVNYYYSMSSLYKRGVFCQEVGHLFGLQHSNTGDCMGLGYYSSTTYYVGSHNINDVYNKYRYSHH